MTKHHMGAGFKPRAWRQTAIGIGREFIPPQFFLDDSDNAADDACAHGTPQARKGYAIQEGDLPILFA
jgi:hypothetical protein